MEMINLEKELPLRPSSILILMSVGIMAFNFVGFIVSYVLFKEWSERSYYFSENAKNLMNFNLSFALYTFISGILVFLVMGIIIVPVLSILYFIFAIKGIIKYANEMDYDYPLTIRFIK